MFRLVIAALIVCATSGRKFQNPVSQIGGSPGVLLYRGQYYAVTDADPSNPDKIPIQVSSDLQTWNHAGYAFPKNYIPAWAEDNFFRFPELHQISESEFRLYFTALHSESGLFALGVAYSQTVLGPYIATNQPLKTNDTVNLMQTLVQDGARKYLIWNTAGDMHGRELNADCLSFIEGSEEKLIMLSDLPWEAGYLESPWYVLRPDGWYMFYSSLASAIGVARCQNPLGPFEKHGDPIIAANYAALHPSYCSVVPDIFVGATVMVYQTWVEGCSGMCTMSQSVEWGADGWPYMNPY